MATRVARLLELVCISVSLLTAENPRERWGGKEIVKERKGDEGEEGGSCWKGKVLYDSNGSSLRCEKLFNSKNHLEKI